MHLSVIRVSGGTTEFEIFDRSNSNWVEHEEVANSNTSPSNATGYNVVSVGVVDCGDFPSASCTRGIKQGYSSQGPGNSGMTLPDIADPTNTTGFTYGNGFGGTSSATPNSTGEATAFWSSAPTLSASGVAICYTERRTSEGLGLNGNDNIYDNGGLQLHYYRINTKWVDCAGNVGGSGTLPYYYVADTKAAAVAGGRVVFPAGNYPELITLTKNLLYETVVYSALLGL